MPELVDAVKRGVLAAGGLPLDFPTISLGEVFLNPTSLMYRNLMAMDVEEMIRAQPMDAVALIGGCDGAILKRAAADPSLFEREGRAVVFEDLEELAACIDAPDLDVEPDDFLVLKNAGPIGAGMPEAGYLPIPAKLARAGVKDMVRISDARMSGTAFGTVVLHVSPEAAVGGPLALVRTGDRIRLSVRGRRYRRLYRDQVLQAEQGCDFGFLVGPP